VFVANWSAGPILLYDSNGQSLGTIGAGGAGPGQFFRPHGMTVDLTGNLFVADTDNHRVQKLTSSGLVLSIFGSPGAGPGRFNLPVDVELDAAGLIYVTDHQNHRVQAFGPGITSTRTTTWGRIKAAYR
jgi:DNA-binding beta-propeller fold protein YncE